LAATSSTFKTHSPNLKPPNGGVPHPQPEAADRGSKVKKQVQKVHQRVHKKIASMVAKNGKKNHQKSVKKCA
jgi:hypothetical protein